VKILEVQMTTTSDADMAPVPKKKTRSETKKPMRVSIHQEPGGKRRAKLAGADLSNELEATVHHEKYSNATMLFLLGLNRRRTPINIVTEIEKGLSFEAIERIADVFSLTVSSFAKDYLDMSPSTVTRRKKAGLLKPMESDRAVRFARLVDQAIELYEGDEDAAERWLETPLPALNGHTPMDYARTEAGFREVENLIVSLEHGMVY
jgi:putative toxin-antitoxin system antitoxin component (TIGR02293 family)